MRKISLLFISIVLIAAACTEKNQTDYSGWGYYAGSKDGNRYSSNTLITPENVAQLEVAWVFSSGDKDPDSRSQNQCNPIMVDGVLYGTTPRLKLFALNA